MQTLAAAKLVRTFPKDRLQDPPSLPFEQSMHDKSIRAFLSDERQSETAQVETSLMPHESNTAFPVVRRPNFDAIERRGVPRLA